MKKPSLFFQVIIFLFISLILSLSIISYYLFSPITLPKNYRLIIAKGESVRKISNKLVKENIITSANLFNYIIKISHKDTKISAGAYLLPSSISLWDLALRLTNGKPDQISITLLDGWNFKQIKAQLKQEPQLTHTTESMSEEQILQQLNLPYGRMEGLLYPATYFIAPQQTDLELMQQASQLMQQKLTQIWQQRSLTTQYTNPYQLLIMASLIQKETNNHQDMYQIAAVFNNRLRHNMRLQDDPAVFYGLDNKEVIKRADFAIDTPYNTYLHNGLPPTPITTPSLEALKAAANPTANDKILYFIAIGQGKSKFFTNYTDHTKAVNYYLKKK
jgi:UPF0755 protein